MEDNNLSQSLEDYLEAIYWLSDEKSFTHANKISEFLQVGKSSVSWALKQLSDKGLINYTPYEAITLTETGKARAAALSRRHHDIKNFLTKVLTVAEDAAEANACRMEHVLDKAVLKRMKDFVAFLDHCPRAGDEWLAHFARFSHQPSDPRRCADCIAGSLTSADTDAKADPLVRSASNRINYTVKHCEDIIRECGQELSEAQSAVIKAFFHVEHHSDAETLTQRVRQDYPDITLKQVEQTMLLLCEHRIARRVRFQDKIVYELFQPHSHHDHMYCVKCGSIIEFFDPRIEALQVDNARRASFRPLMHHLNIYGLCDDCISEQEHTRRLTDCHVGERLVVSQITAEAQAAKRLADMGIVPGAAIEILNQRCSGGNLIVLLGQSRLMLDPAAAETILVTVDEGSGDSTFPHFGRRHRRRRHPYGSGDSSNPVLGS